MDFWRSRKKASSEIFNRMTRVPIRLLEFPIEIRLQIFDYVLQDVFLHVTPRPGAYPYAKWTYLRCTRRTSQLDGHWILCCPYAQRPTQWYNMWSTFLPQQPGVMSLLLSCRTLSADFVGLLYSRALFDFPNLEDYLDFARYAPSTTRQLKHIRTHHIDINCPFKRNAHGPIRMQKDRTFSEALQRMFLHTPRLESLRLIIESTALWETKPQHQKDARWARMIVDLAKLRRQLNCYCERPRTTCLCDGEIRSSIVRFDVAVLPEGVVQSSPSPTWLPNFVGPPRVEDGPDLDRTLSWLLSEVIGKTH